MVFPDGKAVEFREDDGVSLLLIDDAIGKCQILEHNTGFVVFQIIGEDSASAVSQHHLFAEEGHADGRAVG